MIAPPRIAGSSARAPDVQGKAVRLHPILRLPRLEAKLWLAALAGEFIDDWTIDAHVIYGLTPEEKALVQAAAK